jgi:3-dehydroquinate synthase class II
MAYCRKYQEEMKMKKERITIFLDAATDLSVACLPDSRADIEKFERRYKKAAKEYADEHNMIIDVETDPTAELPADFDEERHSKIWQAVHNMIPN